MIFLIITLGLVLRLININQSFWLDEASQAQMSLGSIYSIWFERVGDFHPPLSYIFSHFWMQISTDDIWLRFLPISFGLISIYLIYLIAKKIFSKKIGLVAAFLLSISPYHIYYSQEFRMYSQLNFFVLLTVYGFLNYLDKKSLKNSLVLIISSSLVLYTHYFGIFILLSFALFILMYEKKDLLKHLFVLFGVLLTYLPWIPQLSLQLENGMKADMYLPGWSRVLSVDLIKAIPLTFLKFSLGPVSFDNEVLYLVISLFVVPFFVLPLLFLLSKKIDRKGALIWFWFLGPLFLSLLVCLYLPIFQPFRLLFILPAFLLLLALGISKIKFFKTYLSLIILVSIFSLSYFSLTPKLKREDWRGAVGYINQNVKENDIVVFVWPQPFPPYQWYGGSAQNLLVYSDKFPIAEEDIVEKLEYTQGTGTLYVFEYLQDLTDPSRLTQKKIEAFGFRLVGKKDFSGVGFVDIYQR